MKKGFTLVELLVVIAIIGILASMVIANLSSARQKARDSRRKEDLISIRNALELFANTNNGKYPLEGTEYPSVLVSTYFQALPIDPLDKSQYLYFNTPCDGGTSSASYYRIMAKLESGVPSELKSCVGDSNKYYVLESK